jgi:hypothetical protein
MDTYLELLDAPNSIAFPGVVADNVMGELQPVCVMDGVGFGFNVIRTSSVETHAPLEIVQRSV